MCNKLKFILLSALFLYSCGYHFERAATTSVSIPYVIGDPEGILTAALIREVAKSPTLRYSHGHGEWILHVKILNTEDERIGFRYDRNPTTGKLRKHLEGIENRQRITAEVLIVSSHTEEILYGPHIIVASSEYDYVDPDSLRDLSVVTPEGKRFSSEAFSLGQLDTFGAAKQDAVYPLYHKLAQNIIVGITTCCE